MFCVLIADEPTTLDVTIHWQAYRRPKVAVLLRQLILATAEPFPSGELDPDGATCAGPAPGTRPPVDGIRKRTSSGRHATAYALGQLPSRSELFIVRPAHEPELAICFVVEN